MKRKVYELAKTFIEKELKIKMPELEAFDYYERTMEFYDDNFSEWCSDNNKDCRYCENKNCYKKYVSGILLNYKNKKKKIHIEYNRDQHQTYIAVVKFKNDYNIFINTTIEKYVS